MINTIQRFRFVKSISFHRDMFPKWSHIVTPLKEQFKNKLNWIQNCQKPVDQIKTEIIKDAVLQYPDHNLSFQVFTDANDLQLGAIILQKGVPIAFYSRKLNSFQNK